ncbi:MAG: C10 family peptidase, partial [Bacteroidales bacterium]|nr:C10 family peptidase [Bacteroidales bacterium]
MKKILLLVVAVVFAANLFAENVNQNKAQKIAKAFAAQRDRNAAKVKTDIVYSHPMPNTRDAAFYVVNLENSGFVIVSANDVAHPVIGYSFDRPWPTTGNIPPQITDYLDDLAGQIEAASQKQSDKAIKAEWQELLSINPNNPPQPKGNRTQVGPLLTTIWDQGQYYNAMCPEDAGGPDGYVWTGCVATAMAQIIRYNQYPQQGRGVHSYNTNYYGGTYGILTVDYNNETYDYSNMPDALTNESTEEQINAVAQLMRDCGVAVNMMYTSWESGAFDMDARAALINFFRYSPDMSFAEKSFFSNDEWNNMLQTDLNANRPVYYAGRGTGGHAFVCDGYNSEGYYHFNFGWSEAGNAWYLLNAVNPLNLSFNSDQVAILGISPDSDGNVILGQMQGTSTFTVDEPLEFYHIMGHNQYEGHNYTNQCDNIVTFISADEEEQMVVDIMEYEDQNITIYDSSGLWHTLCGGCGNDLNSDVSSTNTVSINYSGNLFYAGFELIISQNSDCRMVSNILSSVDMTTVHLSWAEHGNATQWQVEYGEQGFSHGEGTLISVNSTSVDIVFLQKLTKHDIYIRSVCDENEYGLWAKKTVMTDAPYWQDIVTSQPDGYILNEETNTVEISSAEGFAWWARPENKNRNVVLTADIDLSGYKWKKTEIWGVYFNGNGHIISNAYMNENTYELGLFSTISSCTIDNVGVENCYVKGSYRVGCLIGRVWTSVIKNCYVSNSYVEGTDCVGGLIGENDQGLVINNYVNVNVIGNRWTGLMIGFSWIGTIRNCYSAGGLVMRSYCYNAGIVAYSTSGEISNCYSVKLPMGVVGYSGITVVRDTSTFVQANSGWTLLSSVTFDDTPETDLLFVLNKGVVQYNDSSYNTWSEDNDNSNNGYPVFDEKYVVQCPNVSDLLVKNIYTGNEHAVYVGWTETGNSTQWKIRYRRHDIPNSPYTYITTTNNPEIINGIPLEYIYDFSVQSMCGSNCNSGWVETQEVVIDLPLWTDIITECPEGYVEDEFGNVTITSAEGLAWFSILSKNGNYYQGKTVQLANDIDLAGYRWVPIGYQSPYHPSSSRFCGIFDGNNYNISNLYVNCNDIQYAGLFGLCEGAMLKNINILSGSIKNWCAYNSDEEGTGGLAGLVAETSIMNCHSSINVSGVAHVGSLCGTVRSDNYSSIIQNCSATGNVVGREGSGGLAGWFYGNVTVKNSFATGNVSMMQQLNINPWYVGGLVGNFMMASAYNCYSTGTVDINSSYTGAVIGCPYINTHIHYIYGQDGVNPGMELTGNYCEDIADTTQFHHNGNTNSLLSSVMVDNVEYSDLLDALNAWVIMKNDQNLKTWVLDNNTGYPVLGDYFEPSCYNPTELAVSNATVIGDPTIRTQLAWEQIGEPDHWEVLYVAAERDINEGVIVSVDSNPCFLTNIPVGQPLDFYVRAVNNPGDLSGWSEPVTYIPDKLRWTEVVTTKPDGYLEDINGDVYISTAEGLAWLSSVTNGLNGSQTMYFNSKKVYLLSDINISEYRWTAMGSWGLQSFDGNGHTISGLYCNELSDGQGLFMNTNGIMIENLSLRQCDVWGEVYVGILAGSGGGTIMNCSVEGDAHGIQMVGGLFGISNHGRIVNSCYQGNVIARSDITKVNCVGGYIGGISGTASENAIINCYIVSEIDDASYAGIITGIGNVPDTVSNCFYKVYQTNLPITTAESYTANNSSFFGSGITWNLNNPPYVNGEFHTDLLSALNAWVDANNTNGEYLHWVADTAMVNGGFPMLEVPTYYTITVSSNPEPGGTVAGGGDYLEGAQATLTATANTGYHFVNWTLNGVSVSNNLSFTITVTEAANYIANFELNSYQITATANPTSGGTVSGSGTYNYGATATLTATANTGYTFIDWTLNGVSVSTNPSVTITVTEAANYVDNFELNSYQITATANPTSGGTVTGSGTYNYGATATLT